MKLGVGLDRWIENQADSVLVSPVESLCGFSNYVYLFIFPRLAKKTISLVF